MPSTLPQEQFGGSVDNFIMQMTHKSIDQVATIAEWSLFWADDDIYDATALYDRNLDPALRATSSLVATVTSLFMNSEVQCTPRFLVSILDLAYIEVANDIRSQLDS